MQNVQRFMVAIFLFIILVVYYLIKTNTETVQTGFIGDLTPKYSILKNDIDNNILLV